MSEDHPPSVACLKSVFLPLSEALIAQQLLAMRRYAPLVLARSLRDAQGLPAEAIRSLGGLGLPARAFNRLAFALGRRLPFFEAQVRQEGCRLIHALSGREGPWGASLKARCRLPLVTTFQGADVALPRRDPQPYARLFAAGDLFLVEAEAARKELLGLGCPELRLRVHHRGVDLERIPYAERRVEGNGPVNVLLGGRMVERKGIPYALQAFSMLRRYRRQVTLTLIGDGPMRPKIESLAKELGLSDVRLLGAQPHETVVAEMQRAHVYIQPSLRAADGDVEGIPTALIEAQASGLPVISSWHSGIPELVADGRSGYLISERDTHALTERMRHLVEHPELWGPMGRAGRSIVEIGFDLRRQTDALEGLYDGLLASS